MPDRVTELERSNVILRRLLLVGAVLLAGEGMLAWQWVDLRVQQAQAARLRGESALMQAQQLIESLPPTPTPATAEVVGPGQEIR